MFEAAVTLGVVKGKRIGPALDLTLMRLKVALQNIGKLTKCVRFFALGDRALFGRITYEL